VKSELQKKDSKSNSIGIAFEAITNAFCIEDNNKEKAEFSVTLLNQVLMAGCNNQGNCMKFRFN
jgi:hypothetical protein